MKNSERERERGGNNTKHRWVPDTKENRQIRAGRIWKRIRLTHWKPGLERNTASAHWRSCRISNPEQRPSLPSKCVVWLSSDHPHAGYGNLRDGRDICGLCLMPIAHSLSAAWVILTSFTTLFQFRQLKLWIRLNLTLLRKKYACLSEPRMFSTSTWTKQNWVCRKPGICTAVRKQRGYMLHVPGLKLDVTFLWTDSPLASVQIKMHYSFIIAINKRTLENCNQSQQPNSITHISVFDGLPSAHFT